MRSKLFGMIAAVFAFAPMAANADLIIDTTAGTDFSFTCLGIDGQCGETFGQSFTVVGPDIVLDSIGFLMTPVSGTTLDVVLRVFQWNGADRTGPELFSSGVTTLSHTTDSFVNFLVGITLADTLTYMAYLDTNGIGNTNAQRSGFRVHDVDSVYTGGTFGWERNADDNNWNSLNSFDAGFRANFSPAVSVPEPGALALFGIGLLGLGFARRKAA